MRPSARHQLRPDPTRRQRHRTAAERDRVATGLDGVATGRDRVAERDRIVAELDRVATFDPSREPGSGGATYQDAEAHRSAEPRLGVEPRLRVEQGLRGEPCLRAEPRLRAETVYRPGTPLDVAATLSPLVRGHSNPTFAVDRTTGDRWLATRNEQGAATVCIRSVADGAKIVAFGQGAERAVEVAPELLGRGDDWTGLDLRSLPWLHDVRRSNPGLRLCRTNAVFPAIAHAIIEQKVTGLEAHRAWAWLHRRYADPAPGPANVVPRGLLLPLSPEQWRRIPSWDWHRAGVDHARSTAVLRAAVAASALERTLALGRGSDEITARLRTVPGVGVWTAAETTQRSHGDPDAPSFGDYHVAHWVGYAMTGTRTDDEGMRDLLEPWRGHRQRVVRLIALSGRREPRRGARMTVEDHRRR